jgi:starch synthase
MMNLPMTKRMLAAIVTPEFAPLAGAGAVAEYCSKLAGQLSQSGINVDVIVPKYSTARIESLDPAPVFADLPVPLGGERVRAGVFRAEIEGFSLYLIDYPKYFLRERIYGPPTGDYLDNDERFVFFSRAAIEFLLKAGIVPDVIHCHNWPAALVPVFLKTQYSAEPAFQGAATLLTLHSVTEQGEFPAESLAWTELNWDYFNPQQLSLNGKFNFLKAGIVFSDLINAVSPAGRMHLLTRKHSCGLHEILRKRQDTLAAVRSARGPNSWRATGKAYAELYERALKIKRGG